MCGVFFNDRPAIQYQTPPPAKTPIHSIHSVFLMALFLFSFYLKGFQRELNQGNVIFSSFQGYSDIRESPLF